ncbi:AMP-binding protein [Nevskia ramosa]|uniref:AMP-binding protein n=1 Tax=Nevskia ramosa TaxID=64002 RepID=UPI00235461E8|nr:AMP-binding protein [Nevskia ramosa]
MAKRGEPGDPAIAGATEAAAPRVWLKAYASGVPADIKPSGHASLAAIIDSACERYRDLPAFENMGTVLSYDDVDRLSQDFASWLQNVAGLLPGDRVAVMMPNLLQYPIAVFGILRAGLVAVNVNPQYTPRELEHQLKDSGAKAIVIVENCAATLAQVIAATSLSIVITTQIGDLLPFPKSLLTNFVVKRMKRMVPAWSLPGSVPFRTTLARGRAQPYHRVQLAPADIAFLQYTGGTTGLSKGATLSHGNLVANLLQMQAWIGPKLSDGGDIVVTALPLYHIFALTVNCMLFLHVGGKNLLITDPRNLDAFVAELGRQRFTAFTGVNTLFNGLVNHPDFADLDFSALKFTVGGGAAVQQVVAEKWKALTGVALTEGYGLSETSPGVCFSPIDRPDWNGTIGLPLPSTWVSLRDDDEREVAVGKPGELCVKGPQVMRGYWNRPTENAAAFTADGYLKTGDIATVDAEGWFRIVDRKKDMILVSGFNVYPNEIENIVTLHSGVLECACIGIPDPKTGEAVKIFVVRKDPTLTAETLREHCRVHLTGYKLPKAIEFRDALPKSNVGKILRKELRTH